MKFVKNSEYSKKKIVKIVFGNLTDDQFMDIMVRNYKDRADTDEIDWEDEDEEQDNDKVNISEYDDEGNRKKYDEEEDTIDFGEEEDDDDLPEEYELDDDIVWDEEFERNSAKRVRTDSCKKCGNTIKHCTCGNLDGFDDIGETILE